LLVAGKKGPEFIERWSERNFQTRIFRVRTPFQTIRQGWAGNTGPSGPSPCLRKALPAKRRGFFFALLGRAGRGGLAQSKNGFCYRRNRVSAITVWRA